MLPESEIEKAVSARDQARSKLDGALAKLEMQRAQLAKEHLWVLWTDYFKPPHVEQFPQLHDLFWRATKAAGDAKKSNDEADAQKLLDLIDEIAEIFAETKK